MARRQWLAAPLDHKADDRQVVCLLLANLEHQDHHRGIDGGGLQAAAATKKQIERRRRRELVKLVATLPGMEEGADHGFF